MKIIYLIKKLMDLILVKILLKNINYYQKVFKVIVAITKIWMLLVNKKIEKINHILLIIFKNIKGMLQFKGMIKDKINLKHLNFKK